MIFANPYCGPMDRAQHQQLGVEDIGMSVPMGISAKNVEGIYAKIRSGASKIEIAFTGQDKGQQFRQTPGLYGKMHRKALRELADINQIQFSTHAAITVNGLSGQDKDGNFSDEFREQSVDEIKRAIEFAADTAKGGAVVVHTSEFRRPLSEQSWAEDGTQFRQYPEEPERAVKRIVDTRTGRVIQEVRKNEVVPRPIWNRCKGDQSYTDSNGIMVAVGDYIDYENNKVPFEKRVPEYDPEENTFLVHRENWQDMVREADERNQLMEEKLGRSLTQEEKITPEENFIYAVTETRERISLGWAGKYSNSLKDYFSTLEKLKEAKTHYADLGRDEEQLTQSPTIFGDVSGLIPKDIKSIRTILNEKIDDVQAKIKAAQEMVAGQLMKAEEQRIIRDHSETAEKYAFQRSINSYADAGMSAMKESQKKRLKRPLFIALENIYPEQYGSHPDELRVLVQRSRSMMADRLQQNGLSEHEAQQRAESHIRATLDVGHMNIWRKYYQGNDEQFKHWILNETKKLAKEGVIGHVHLSDNFGWADEHLAAGEGNTPIKEVIDVLKKHGYDGNIIAEPGGHAINDLSDVHGLLRTWNYFDSPVYGLHAPQRLAHARQWSDIQYGYFGQVYPPKFIHEPYSPSEEWTTWSEVELE
jgi:Xylose isomerase-like TIM barrel